MYTTTNDLEIWKIVALSKQNKRIVVRTDAYV